MNVLNRTEWAILALVVFYSFIPTFGGLIRVVELAGGPAIAPENLRASATPSPIVAHILGSFVFCLLGVVQFLPSIRRWHPELHRILGRSVAVAGCLSAASGMWMTHFYSFPITLQGNLLYWTRMGLGSLMICFIVWSVLAIRSRKVTQHSAYMLRAYAIGQGASTQTFIGIGWMIVYGTEATGLLRDAMMVFAWAFNLAIAEALIWTLLPPKRMSATVIVKMQPSSVGQ